MSPGNDAHVQDPGSPTLDHLVVAAPLISLGSPSHDHRFQDGLDARHAVERRRQGIADPVLSVTHPPPPPLAEEAVQGLCQTLGASLRLPSLALSTQSLCLACRVRGSCTSSPREA